MQKSLVGLNVIEDFSFSFIKKLIKPYKHTRLRLICGN